MGGGNPSRRRQLRRPLAPERCGSIQAPGELGQPCLGGSIPFAGSPKHLRGCEKPPRCRSGTSLPVDPVSSAFLPLVVGGGGFLGAGRHFGRHVSIRGCSCRIQIWPARISASPSTNPSTAPRSREASAFLKGIAQNPPDLRDPNGFISFFSWTHQNGWFSFGLPEKAIQQEKASPNVPGNVFYRFILDPFQLFAGWPNILK